MNKPERYLQYLILILILIGGSSQTNAFDTCKTEGGKDIKWYSQEATYYINDSGGPSETQAAVETGMQTWTNVVSSDFVFFYGGTTSSTSHGTNDGMNIVTFGSLDSGTVAENRYWYSTSPPFQEGRLQDSDIRFNTYYSWSTDASPGTMDVQNVGTHEHGHSLCLLDLYGGANAQKTMYGIVAFGETKKQTLEQDDIDGITYLYPCQYLPVSIEGIYFYYTLQDAYDNAFSNDIILSHASVFNEGIIINANKTIYLEAGYNCDYLTFAGVTTVTGTITITDGTLIISDGTLVLQ